MPGAYRCACTAPLQVPRLRRYRDCLATIERPGRRGRVVRIIGYGLPLHAMCREWHRVGAGMSYLHIDNLYKAQEIFLFRRCYAMEKIHGCLKKGTLVSMANGTKVPIEQIKRKDNVLSYNFKKQEFAPAVVEGLVIQERDVRLGWMEVTLQDGRSVICTEDHPFFTRNRGWIAAVALTMADDILTPDDK